MKSHLAVCANEILAVAADSKHSDVSAARRTISAACQGLRATLEELRPNGDLNVGIRVLHARWKDHPEEIRTILSDGEVFLKVFLEKERTILLRAGLRPGIVDLLMLEAEAVRRDLKNFDEDPNRLRDSLDALTWDVCSVHERFIDHVEERRPGLLERVGWVLAGAVIIGSNATVDALLTGGLVPATTAISGAFGGHVITKRL